VERAFCTIQIQGATEVLKIVRMFSEEDLTEERLVELLGGSHSLFYCKKGELMVSSII